MGHWELFLAVLAQLVALGGLILAVAKMISTRLDKRFSDAEQSSERIRMDGVKHWDERFDMRDRLIDELGRRLDANLGDHALLREEYRRLATEQADLRVHLAETYTSREVYIETIAGIHFKLDKLADRLAKGSKTDRAQS